MVGGSAPSFPSASTSSSTAQDLRSRDRSSTATPTISSGSVDIRAVVDICSAFLPGMIARTAGTIVNVASTTAFQPVPTLAVYAAAKAFVLSFSQSLWYEAAQHGVRVFALNPGPTHTEFFDVIGDSATATGTYQTPTDVVATAMKELDAKRSRPHVISGRRNALQAAMAGIVPARVLLPALSRMLH